jgi:hypothetical protein
VAQNREQSGERHDVACFEWASGSANPAPDTSTEKPLEHVECDHQNAGTPAEHARNVGSPGTATATLPDVDPAIQPPDEDPGGDRPDEVTEGESSDKL